MALATTFVAATFVSAGSVARGGPVPSSNPTMIPILEVKRVTSADHVFIDRALRMAVNSMESANSEIGSANTVDVQDEAVRAFNTAASAYNDLADIAARRDMNFPKPKASQLDDPPALAQDAKPDVRDVRYVGETQTDLETAIGFYHDEIQHGKDKLAVAFATKMRPRLIHDLELVTIDIENIDHPKAPPTAPALPDGLATDSGSPAPSASP